MSVAAQVQSNALHDQEQIKLIPSNPEELSDLNEVLHSVQCGRRKLVKNPLQKYLS